jgi:hypothetical protein
VARLLLYKEYWYGTAESTSGLTRKSKQLAAAAVSADADTPSSSSSSSAGATSGSSAGYVLQLLPSHKFDVPVTDLPRPQPQQLAGSWNVFLVAANPIVEENPDTLQVRLVACTLGFVLCSSTCEPSKTATLGEASHPACGFMQCVRT